MKVNINRIKREAKIIPTLIFNIEAWDKQLVATGRAVSKNLLKDARRATCRDFKINNPELKAAAAAAAAAAGRSGENGGATAAGSARSGGGSAAVSGGSRPASRQQSGQPSDAAVGEEGEGRCSIICTCKVNYDSKAVPSDVDMLAGLSTTKHSCV
eukprot:GHUV01057489.1.p2 GENE.GHUV01057489.1~~GHUV01057489.1.p2  ORF type:complete len:156 (+),score=37.65 GHUV01057489.1:297-764(+)